MIDYNQGCREIREQEDGIKFSHRPWMQIKLKKNQIDFLKECIRVAKQNPLIVNNDLAGNIHKSLELEDKNNWFFKDVIRDLTEKFYYENWDNYYRYHIVGNALPEFGMGRFWVNFQKETEFNPLHSHGGHYSFVIFIKIPTTSIEQHSLPFVSHSNSAGASDFEFVWFDKNNGKVKMFRFPLDPEDEGRMLFFPADLNHQVYPFYGTKEERITISGNIYFKEEAKNLLPHGLQEQVNKYMEEQNQGQK